jgi:DNA-binding NarL/FixJ family response regulator
MPRMLREIVKEIVSTQADMEIVGDFAEGLPLLDAVQESGAEFVIAGAEYSAAKDVRTLLDERPAVTVLAVAGDGRQTVLWALEPRPVSLGEVSPQTLLRAIRTRRRVRA